MSPTCSASPVSILDLADMNTSTVIITPTSMIAAAAASESLSGSAENLVVQGEDE